MKKFSALLTQLEKAKNSEDQVIALNRYFSRSRPIDRMWGLWLLTSRKPRKSLGPEVLRNWTLEVTQLPEWLFEESLAATGDLPETCALLWRNSNSAEFLPSPFLSEMLALLFTLSKKETEEKRSLIETTSLELSPKERYWFYRLLLGTFRFKLKTKTLVDALATFTQKEAHTLWHRLVSGWSPNEISFDDLFLPPQDLDTAVKPYSFRATKEVSGLVKPVKNINAYQAEWYWEGIRAQLIRRSGQLFIWTEEGEWLTGKFPEFDELLQVLPEGTVLDGMILGVLSGRVLEAKLIRKRADRVRPTRKLLQECPAVFLANDLLEYKGESQEKQSLAKRFDLLGQLLDLNPSEVLTIAEAIPFANWTALKTMLPNARDQFSKGIILRRSKSVELEPALFLPCPPLKMLVVLLYVARDERKPGNFASLSFGVWKNEDLVPIAKCPNLLSPEEKEALKAFVQQNTIERFGPVISVEADLVFEISYTGLILSARKKSGLDVQFPVLNSWEKERTIDEVVDLADLHRLQRKLSGEGEIQ